VILNVNLAILNMLPIPFSMAVTLSGDHRIDTPQASEHACAGGRSDKLRGSDHRLHALHHRSSTCRICRLSAKNSINSKRTRAQKIRNRRNRLALRGAVHGSKILS
jgi:hypothetical protein